MKSMHQQIAASIAKRKKGELIFFSDFRGQGTTAALKMALSRMNKEGVIKRLAHGVYYIPQQDPLFGPLFPAPEQVAEIIAKKEKIRIKPSGAYALHKLGLTTQVPTQLVYITDGENRQIKMGKTLIRFKATTPKRMALKGALSSLIIQALEELDLDKIENTTKEKIKSLLKKENQELLQHDLTLAPNRIHDFILCLLNS
jgi:hypothetical protein